MYLESKDFAHLHYWLEVMLSDWLVSLLYAMAPKNSDYQAGASFLLRTYQATAYEERGLNRPLRRLYDLTQTPENGNYEVIEEGFKAVKIATTGMVKDETLGRSIKDKMALRDLSRILEFAENWLIANNPNIELLTISEAASRLFPDARRHSAIVRVRRLIENGTLRAFEDPEENNPQRRRRVLAEEVEAHKKELERR